MAHTAIRYHGGKFYLASKIVELMPKHTTYLEAYAGGLSVLLAKPCEGVAEYVNDLNGELINFWRVLRDTPDSLLRTLLCTPLSQELFGEAKRVAQYDDVKRAIAFFIRARQSRQGLGKDYCTPTSRLRRGMNENVSAWMSAIDGLPEIAERLMRVEIWKLPAVQAIAHLDGPELLVYADPPYLFDTRVTTGEYGDYEMTEAQHVELLDALANMEGKFILSGYHSKMYDSAAALHGWNVKEFDLPNNASGAKSKKRKKEVVWMNY